MNMIWSCFVSRNHDNFPVKEGKVEMIKAKKPKQDDAHISSDMW